MHSLPASPLFKLVVLVTLGVIGFIGVVLLQPSLFAGLLGPEMTGHISGHFRHPQHRVHDLAFAFLFGTGVVGLLAQLRRPAENVAGQLMALIPWVALVLASALTGSWVFAPLPFLGALTLLATVLHPTGHDYFRSFRVSRVSPVMLVLIIIAAVPLLAFGSTNLRLQVTVANEHAALGHYAFMAAFSFTVVAVGLLASLRPNGWWLPAWVAGLLPALLGFTSLTFPNVDSSLSLIWALAAIAWGVGFVAAAELTQDLESPTLLGSRRRYPETVDDIGGGSGRASPPSTPRWARLVALLVLGLGLLFGILHLAGGALGGHQ